MIKYKGTYQLYKNNSYVKEMHNNRKLTVQTEAQSHRLSLNYNYLGILLSNWREQRKRWKRIKKQLEEKGKQVNSVHSTLPYHHAAEGP